MTLSTTISRKSAATDGTSTVFTYPYYFLKDADLVVIKKDNTTGVETPLVLNTDYTVQNAGNPAGGSITTIGPSSPLVSGSTLTIYRDPAIVQETHLVENDPLPAAATEKVFDLAAMIQQRTRNWVSRTAKISDGTPDGVFDPTFPVDITLFPNSVPMLNGTATGFALAASWPTGPDIVNAQAWALISEGWAVRTTGLVEDTIGGSGVDNSAKSYAIGGTGAGQPAGGDAKSWAIKTSAAVITGQFSSKEWAVGVQNRGLANGGSAKDWATYTGGTVDNAEFSAKKYATDAANSAASAIGNDIVFLDNSGSPYSIDATYRGKLIAVDASSGPVVLNLVQISTLTLYPPGFPLAIKKTDNSPNHVTINTHAGDTFDDGTATAKVLHAQGDGTIIFPKSAKWVYFDTGGAGSAGGGGNLNWVESDLSPASQVDSNNRAYTFQQGQGQSLYALIKVPSGYILGNQIKLKTTFYSNDTTGNVLVKTIATLIRPGTDLISSTTNQRTSTNSAVTLSGGTQNKPQEVDCDLTDTAGKINGVAVSPGDLINVQLTRDASDTGASDAFVPVYGSEVSFS